MALYDTVANVVSDTAVELGLGAVPDVYVSTDPNVIQLRTLLKRVGRHLAKQRQWKQLLKEHTFTTTSAVSYNLPADFGAFVDQTAWNRTQNRQMGVATPQEWQYLEASASGTVTTVIFRTFDQTLEVWPNPPTSGETIAFEYLSRYWVAVTGSTTGSKDAPTLNNDVLLFEPFVLMPALKVAWLQAKGFDSSGAVQEFNEAFASAASANEGAAPTLNLNQLPFGQRFHNVPNTGFGFDGVGGLY